MRLTATFSSCVLHGKRFLSESHPVACNSMLCYSLTSVSFIYMSKIPFRNFETEFDGRALGGRCEAMALSSILDSEATFVQQAQEVGLGEPWIDALRTNSLATFAKLSFAITSPDCSVGRTDQQVSEHVAWWSRSNNCRDISFQTAFV